MRRSRLIIGGAGLALVLLLGAWAVDGLLSVPTFESVAAGYRTSESYLLDRDGAVIHEFRQDYQGRRLGWVSHGEISPALIEAVVLAEDKRFFQHSGVDWQAVAAGLWQWIETGTPRGSSTITMQLVGLVREDLRRSGRFRSVGQKFLQLLAALRLEVDWEKEQILEAYLNLVSFRGELEGIGAASRGMFGKVPHGLTLSESVILAALIRSPNASKDRLMARADQLFLNLGGESGGGDLERILNLAVDRPAGIDLAIDWAPHVARALSLSAAAKGRDRTAIPSHLDGGLQRFATDSMRYRLRELARRNVQDGAVLVVENETGNVLAYVGNGDPFTSARHVDGVTALRQAGSTLKPFLYGLAFERRLLTAASYLDDLPLELVVSGGVYRPDNYDRLFRGPVTSRVALASSLNVPAVRVLDLVGVEPFLKRLHELGFKALLSAGFYGPSLALGAAEVRLCDLVNAYRTLANRGLWSPLDLGDGPQEGGERRVFEPDTAFLVADILSDRESRHATFDLESPLSTRYWAAVKTGTSKDMRDNWCVGFSSDFTVGVWVGNFSGEPMWNVSGITGAAPVWVEVMNYLHRRQSSHPGTAPDGLIQATFSDVLTGSDRREWFLRGTEPREIKLVSKQKGVPRIVYPVADAILAVDPDIPEGRQRAFFEAESASEQY
ncbi:MAG: penicillin-binding protein 1C, partial [Acidobacteriota bacterium]